MSNTNNGGPAFPHELLDLHEPNTAGMTLRDYFAAKAMQGGMAHNRAAADKKGWAMWAYQVADEMLKAREL